MQNKENMFYGLGQRDMLAFVLADNMGEKKLRKEAELYKEKFGYHFSLEYHLE